MNTPQNQGPGKGAPPDNNNGRGTQKAASVRSHCKSADLAGNSQLMKQVRQIITETPEVRPEKVGPLKEAVEQGIYEVDVRKLANSLIAELILKR